MKTIYRFSFSPDKPIINMPKGARVLSTAAQNDVICVWALVDSHAPVIKYRFHVLGTGHDANEVTSQVGTGVHLIQQFVGTVFMNDGISVFHIFVEDLP